MSEAMEIDQGNIDSEITRLTRKRFLETQDYFLGHHYKLSIPKDPVSYQSRLQAKIYSEFYHVKDLPPPVLPDTNDNKPSNLPTTPATLPPATAQAKAPQDIFSRPQTSQSIVPFEGPKTTSGALTPIHRTPPAWHAPWKIMRVSYSSSISHHNLKQGFIILFLFHRDSQRLSVATLVG
jgi:hypothetical protein